MECKKYYQYNNTIKIIIIITKLMI